MANNPYVNKVQLADGTSLMDITGTTAVATDVLAGKYFFSASGELTLGTNQGGSGDGYVWQDAQGYVHLSDEEGTQPIYDTLNVSGSGTFTPSQGHAYNSVVVPSGTATAPNTISGTSASVSTGTNTLTLTKTVSVTPSVTTAGYVSSGTAGNASVSLTASVNTRSSSDLSASGDTVTVPSGYYASNASKAVSSGTEGTPTATKGTVSNHAVTVTPSVTNSAGYISGGTKTGTAVTVTASELVSGTKSITANGTGIDVASYASVDVNVPSSGGSSYTLIASTSYQVSTTSTTAVSVGTFETGDTSIWTSDKMVFVKIRDLAGRRNGYFYGSDSIICNNVPGNNLSSTSNYLIYGTMYYQNTAGNLINMNLQRTRSSYQIEGYGVYPRLIYDDGSIDIFARYSTSSYITTQTIDGTFNVEVYLLKWPDNINPFIG